MNELLLSFQTKEKRSEQSEKQRVDPKEESKDEIPDQALRIQRLEKKHNEKIEDVLKDAKNIKPYEEASYWI